MFYAVLGLEGSPYAPERIIGGPDGELTYTYNTMGQRLGNGLSGRSKQTIEWGLIDKPVKIIKGINNRPDDYVEFSYGPGGQRYLRKDKDGSKTYYVGDMEYRVAGDGTSQSVVYIRNGGYSPVAMVSTSGGTSEYTYFQRDHVGSSVVAVDDEANVIEGSSHGHHDPWGQPWSADGSKNELKEDSRGFTGHENIASVGLIHMNGRVYDPMIGQFTGPDRFIQNAGQLVGLNRYAYIGNSPVNGTDPTGWAREKFGMMILEHGDPIPRDKFIYATMTVENESPGALRATRGGDTTPGRLTLGYANEGAVDPAGRSNHRVGGHIALLAETMGWETVDEIFRNTIHLQVDDNVWSAYPQFGNGRIVAGGFKINGEGVLLHKYSSFSSWGMPSRPVVEDFFRREGRREIRLAGGLLTTNPIAPNGRQYFSIIPLDYWRDFVFAISERTNMSISLEPRMRSPNFTWGSPGGLSPEEIENGLPRPLLKAYDDDLPNYIREANTHRYNQFLQNLN
jgi:RHS repeat-associated protein